MINASKTERLKRYKTGEREKKTSRHPDACIEKPVKLQKCIQDIGKYIDSQSECLRDGQKPENVPAVSGRFL